MALIALVALGACGVDGVPIRPGSQDELAPAPNETPGPANGIIGGTARVRTGMVL